VRKGARAPKAPGAVKVSCRQLQGSTQTR